jgi:hypothetical protein
VQRRIEALEPSIQALLPEQGRFDRPRHEAQSLLQQYPNPEDRPPRGLWAANGDRTPWLIEGGKGTRPLAAHFQLRPDPLAK